MPYTFYINALKMYYKYRSRKPYWSRIQRRFIFLFFRHFLVAMYGKSRKPSPNILRFARIIPCPGFPYSRRPTLRPITQRVNYNNNDFLDDFTIVNKLNHNFELL